MYFGLQFPIFCGETTFRRLDSTLILVGLHAWTDRNAQGTARTLSAALEFQTIVGFALNKTPGGHPGCRPHCFPSQLAAAARCAPRQHRLVFIISIEAVRGRGGTARPPPARPSGGPHRPPPLPPRLRRSVGRRGGRVFFGMRRRRRRPSRCFLGLLPTFSRM